MSRRVADLLVETLQAADVKTCYGIVGDTMNRIAHALHHSEIDWVHMRHEEAGAFLASAEALLTAKAMLHAKGHDVWESSWKISPDDMWAAGALARLAAFIRS